MRYTLDEFLALSRDEQTEYWNKMELFVAEAHMTYCYCAIVANADSIVDGGKIPMSLSCDCDARNL